MSKLQTTKMKCPKCGYEWITASKMYYVSCPRCLRKVERKKEDESKET